MNISIVIALPKIEDAKKIRTILKRHGFEVADICNTGAGALASMSNLDAGILICGYHFPDMYYHEILELKTDYFEVLLIASEPAAAQADPSITAVSPPLRAAILVQILSEMAEQLRSRIKKQKKGPRSRSEREKRLISEAKQYLMEKNGWREEEAHRYIQKCSMDYGRNLAETAEMIRMMSDPDHFAKW